MSKETANEREEDIESSFGSESSSKNEGHEVELNITMDDVVDSEESEPEFSEEDWDGDAWVHAWELSISYCYFLFVTFKLLDHSCLVILHFCLDLYLIDLCLNY